MTRVTVRGFIRGVLQFEETLDAEKADRETVMRQLAQLESGIEESMVEIEFLDEPDASKRFFRFGSDPRWMVCPMKIPIAGT
jgi:hypothetical protein